MTLSVYNINGFQVAVRDLAVKTAQKLIGLLDESQKDWSLCDIGKTEMVGDIPLRCIGIDRYHGFIEFAGGD